MKNFVEVRTGESVGRRVLIIGDEKTESVVLKLILAESGFEASTVRADSDMAETLAGNSEFDLIVVDMTTGTAGDSEKLQRTRKAMPGTAVLLMTDNGTIRNALENIAETDFGIEYLKKPFPKDEFLFAVRRMMSRARSLRVS